MQDSLIICIYGYIVILITSVINNVAHFVTSNQLFVLVCLSVCWFVCLFGGLSVWWFVRLFGGLSVCVVVCLSVRWFVCMFPGLSVCLVVCLSVCWFGHMFAGLAICLVVCLSFFLVCPSVWWSVCLFAGFSVYLWAGLLSKLWMRLSEICVMGQAVTD